MAHVMCLCPFYEEKQSLPFDKMEDTTQTCVAFPPEILSYLFRFLDARDICVPVSSVCWAWRQVALDSQLWRDLCIRRWKNLRQDATASWKSEYIHKDQVERNWRSGSSQTQNLTLHKGAVMSVGFDDQKIVTCGEDATCQVVRYDSTPTGLTVFDGVGIVNGLAWLICLQLEENLLFTGSDGGYTQLYDISDIIPSKEDDSQTSKTLSKPKQKFLGHTGSVFGLKFNPALNQLVTACSDTKVRVYDVETGKIVTTYVGHTNGVRSCTFSPDEANFIVTGSYDTTVKFWDRRIGECVQSINNMGIVSSVQLDDRKLITASYDAVLRRFDLATFKCTLRYSGHTGRVFGLQYDNSTGKLLSTSSGSIRVWDIETGKKWAKTMHFPGKAIIHSLQYSDDLLVSTSFSGTTHIHYYGVTSNKRKRDDDDEEKEKPN